MGAGAAVVSALVSRLGHGEGVLSTSASTGSDGDRWSTSCALWAISVPLTLKNSLPMEEDGCHGGARRVHHVLLLELGCGLYAALPNTTDEGDSESIMKHLTIFSASIAFLVGCGDKDTASSECGAVYEVTTTEDTSDMESYLGFSPEDLTIAVGDCVSFVMSETHNAIEVSQESYESLDGAALDGGFQVQLGETAEVYFAEAGTHYYVCQPHVSMGMIGTITVQ